MTMSFTLLRDAIITTLLPLPLLLLNVTQIVRVEVYRGGAPLVDVKGRVVLVVDDGLATGVSARAAMKALKVCHYLLFNQMCNMTWYTCYVATLSPLLFAWRSCQPESVCPAPQCQEYLIKFHTHA
jgi:hypoxanthine phosphoribosyltransferase